MNQGLHLPRHPRVLSQGRSWCNYAQEVPHGEDIMNAKLWIISFEIRGEEVVTLFTQETADLAQALAVNPDLVDRLDVGTMTFTKEGGRK